MGDVIIEQRERVGFITLNRVKRNNALVPEFLEEIREGIKRLDADKSLCAIILKAEGKVFSTGGDVKGFYNHRQDLKMYSESVVGLLNQLIMDMIHCSKPIITAVNGMVTGGSMGLVLASDIVLLSPRATFTPYYATVGFSPDGGWTALLKEMIGIKRAANILMTDTTITPKDALDWGIASKVIEEKSLYEEAEKIAKRISTLKKGSLQNTKKLLWNEKKVVADLEKEKKAFIEQISGDEGQTGMKEFLDSLKR